MAQEAMVYWAHHRADKDIATQGYVGATIDLERREREHLRGYGGSSLLYDAILKHGGDIVFEVVMRYNTKEEALIAEKKLRPEANIGYNQYAGGGGTTECSDETRKKMSLAQIGIKKSEEEKRKISTANKGQYVSEEQKEHLRIVMKGKVPWNKGIKTGPLTEERKRQIGEASRRAFAAKSMAERRAIAVGRMLSPESRQKISEALTGRKHTEETKEKMRQAKLGKSRPPLTQEHKDKISASLRRRVA